MNFDLSEEQQAVQQAARAVFERGGSWADLANANLLGIALPESAGGSNLGMVELALLLVEQGRTTTPLPVWPSVLAALAADDAEAATRVARGDAVLSVALGDGVPVPYGEDAERVLVGRQLVEPEDVVAVETTDRQPAALMSLGPIDLDPWVRDRVLIALCAQQVGVCEAAVEQTAAYVSQREQFGRPIGTFQAVAHRASDAFIDLEAMRLTMLAAAWRLDAGLDAAADIRVAKWWAAEAGHRIVHAAQHLHGGIGADVEYPIHRYFLWGKQLAVMLGGGSEQLSALADLVAV